MQWLRWEVRPWQTAEGVIGGIVIFTEDITARNRAEEDLRESEERFRVAQELSPDGFTILRPVRDVAGQIVDFTWVYENAAIARLNGTDPAIVVGRRLSEFLPGHTNSPFHNVYVEVAETRAPQVLEGAYEGDSIPRRTWFRVVVVPMGTDIAILGPGHHRAEASRASSARQ